MLIDLGMSLIRLNNVAAGEQAIPWHRMRMISNIFSSSLGKKYVMAVSGFVMFLFVIGHLAGNLQEHGFRSCTG